MMLQCAPGGQLGWTATLPMQVFFSASQCMPEAQAGVMQLADRCGSGTVPPVQQRPLPVSRSARQHVPSDAERNRGAQAAAVGAGGSQVKPPPTFCTIGWPVLGQTQMSPFFTSPGAQAEAAFRAGHFLSAGTAEPSRQRQT